jgi:hypothetical protein
MAEVANRNEVAGYPVKRTAWGAIWMGVFTFVAIWSVFGLLGEAIFASAANPNTAQPTGGIGVGMSIWAIILSIIAMYVAGRVTSHFSGLAERSGRIMHGIAMFGLSVTTVVLMVILSGLALSGETGVVGGAHNPYMLTVFSDVGWIGFAALFLGWLGAIWGASQETLPRATSAGPNVRDIRTAA